MSRVKWPGFWLVLNATVLGDGGDPDLAGGELNIVTVGVAEDDLAGLRGFSPGALDGLAILENGSRTSADSSDRFVIAITINTLGYYHGNDYAWCELNGLATLGFGVGFGQIGRTLIGSVRLAGGVEAKISISDTIVTINSIESLRGSKL